MAKIVFMGTPGFALPSLKALLAGHELLAALTQPDKPAGRSKVLRQSPVKRAALAAGLPILQPRRIRYADTLEALRKLDADVFVVVAYGQILPQALLDLPRYGTVNVHASLLPRWRGAAPIQAAIRAGDPCSGVSIMLLDAGLDTGPLLAARSLELAPRETGASLHDKLAVMGAALLAETLPPYLSGDIAPVPQDASLATYAPQIKKTDGEIDWRMSAVEIDRLVRAFTPWPGSATSWQGKTLKIIAGQAGPGQAAPGRVTLVDGRIAIGTGECLYLPARLQLAGKQALDAGDFLNGYRQIIGAQLGGGMTDAAAGQ